jgi:hypothetical protein
MTEHCKRPYCRVYHLTVREFCRLGGEDLTQGFVVRLGQRASAIYRSIYGKDPKQKRKRAGWRNKVGYYPCGVLEQAYKELKAELECPGIQKDDQAVATSAIER